MSAEYVTRMACWFGPIGGGAPDYSEPPSSEWSVTRIDESDPAHPRAELARALTDFAVDRTSLFEPREVHIWACDITVDETDPDYRVTPLFWGEVHVNSLRIRSGETETALAQVRRFHYGVPLEGEQVYDPDNEDVSIVHRDARFNPTIDAKPAPNMAERVAETGYPDTHNLWLDPESGRTDAALAVHQQTEAKTWTLGLAVESLQRLLNPDETYLTNPTIQADPEVPEAPFDAVENPENVTLRRGLFLDECLRQLLPQYGCGHFIRLTVDDASGHATRAIVPEIAYYRRGQGDEKDLKLQAPGAVFDADTTNLLTADISFDVSEIVNRVTCHGHLQEREVTLELQRAWPATDDALTVEELTRGAEGSVFPTKSDVHRKWVANEAGDYDGSRTEIVERPDLSDVFDGYVPKRRRLYPPLTYRNQADTETGGLRGPVKVEYTTAGPYAVAADWKDVTGDEANARFVVLPNEIGVYFNQPAPPEELVDSGGSAVNLRLRVTGTLIGDQAVTHTADVAAWSPLETPVTLVVDVSDRFFDRQRQTTGPHASVLTGAHDERDDATSLQTFAESLRDNESAASVTARITLSGIVTDYEIGDLLTGISGRNISFNRSSDPETPLYVQIVGRIFDASQQTTLLVAPYDTPQVIRR